MCISRFGRTDIIEIEKDGVLKKTARILLACGYREVDPEECICCGGFTNIKIELNIDTFIIMNRRPKRKCNKGSGFLQS